MQTKEPKAVKAAKVRVFNLAKELKLEATDVIEFCKELGFTSVKNQLNGLEPEQVEALRERAKKGVTKSHGPSTPVATSPPKPTIPPPAALTTATKVRTLPPPKPAAPRAHPAPTHVPEPEPVYVEPAPEPVAEVHAPVVAPPVKKAPPVAHPPSPPPPPNLAAIATGATKRPTNLSGNRPAPKPPVAKPPATNVTPATTVSTPAPAAAQPTEPVHAPTTLMTPAAETAHPATSSTPATVSAEHSPVEPAVAPKPTHEPVAPAPTAATPAPTPTHTHAPTPASTTPAAPAAGAPRPAVPPATFVPPSNTGRPGNNPTILPPNSNRPTRQGMPMQMPSSRPQGQGQGQGPGQGQGSQQGHGPRPHGGGGGSQRPGGGGQRHGYSQSSGPRSISNHPRTGGSGPGGPTGVSTGNANRPAPTPKPGPQRPTGQTKLTPEQITRLRELSQRGQRIDPTSLAKVMQEPKPVAPGTPAKPTDDKTGARGPVGRGRPAGAAEDEDEKKKGIGAVTGRDARARGRATTGRDRKPTTDRNAVIIGTGGSVEMIEQQTGSRRGPRQALLNKMKRRQQQQVVKKEGPVEIAEPITVRSLSEAIGMKAGELGKRLLKETNQLYGNNSAVAFEVAELIAIEKGITLALKKQATAESRLLDEYEKRAHEVDPALLQPRAPIVTIMGHVDHGKTSLLDKIRQEFGLASDVVSTEAGGITQVIRAWQVAKDEKHITFLDTPGHEAFTKMRARGANVTDIVVIVVAATDGVMPQTEEAIAHARAADVDIIVAINKVDMPNANIEKTRRQLYSLNLLPDDMGGDTPFVETSAVTGQGVAELLESVLLVAELADLKADPTHPASGTCLEAYQDSDEGVKATLIVQQGTLRKGDVILCGATFGRVRMMYNDMGKPVDEAGPSTPVKITGLDDVPDADDPFYAVEDIGTAREIAEKRKVALRGTNLNLFTPVSLDNLAAVRSAKKMTELKVILKAEARGSVEAIRKELEKLVHDEVRCRVLHAGIGAITESDVILGLTSPEDTMVIGFNVTTDDAALKLAENRKVSIREFDIIYKLTDAVKSALEGKLKPVEEVVHLGRAIIRNTFKISKVGTIAGCYVTSGVIERSARVRVIRNGVVIFPQGEKVVGLDSLKRFKDDAKEVREGFECGMKLTGFDDLKVDDVIEAYKIEIRHRTL